MTTTSDQMTDTRELRVLPPERPAASRPELDQPRAIGARSTEDVLAAVGALVASFALVWFAYFELLPLSGVVGFVICWYFGFLAMYAGLSALEHPRPVVIGRVLAAVVTLAGLLVAGALVWVVVYTIGRGAPALHHLNFFTQDSYKGSALVPLTKGGIANALVGSGIEVGIAIGFSLPLGLITAIYMSELGGRYARVVRTGVESMTAMPDLLAGLFVYVVLIHTFHQPKDGFDAAVALAITMTPIIARSALVQLAVVPGGLREASLALGSNRWKMVTRVVLPTARSGLATSLILAVARGIGETAPLLIVSGANGFMQTNPFGKIMNSLPLYIYSAAETGQPKLQDRAFGAATLLLVIVLLLFVIARLVARQRISDR